ncbi:SDR family NAD(P)-dependent oxidoreductase [Sinomicrobium soli]|uniref:SDR family NAD(P)-dependent oxidoreductase n=1 Tax=Sinomicrobium sp. N-1-3-6 TaxID=2219864 RepID=UPI000DCBF3B3|nr:SDR family oxidoreductase [Sinomicrobium sp. N-1-3-6]RAV27525.1 short-chain dehydrogenase [Sinomicrobium sp. N-1-3-6]
MSTENKTPAKRAGIALITGGSRGLGRNMAIATARKGLDIVLTYHNNKKAAEEVVAEIEALGQKAYPFQLDTRNLAAFDRFVNEVTSFLQEKTGSPNIDFLVNNAGTALYAPINEVTEEQMDDIYNIHYKGVFFLTQKLLPFINDGGGIVNISSGLTRIVIPGSSVYGALKTAVETQTRYLARELGERKIRANVIAPGAIETDFGGGRVRDVKEYNDMVAGFTALGRVGLPDDIGSVVAFLCSEEAYWINAQRIEVSGGQSI